MGGDQLRDAVGGQLRWMVGQMNSDTVQSDLTDRFSTTFLTEVPPAQSPAQAARAEVQAAEGSGTEATLNLSLEDRRAIQARLTLLGHDTPGQLAKAGRNCDLHPPPAATG